MIGYDLRRIRNNCAGSARVLDFYKMVDDSTNETYQGQLDPLVVSSFGELKWIVVAWMIHAAWVVGYSGLFGQIANRDNPSNIDTSLVFGIPSWVFWGVLMPWASATLFTIWFALAKMQDHEMPESANKSATTTGGRDG